jgi:hypothetical protein
MALMIRNSAINAIAAMIVPPAAMAIAWKIESPRRLFPLLRVDALAGLVGMERFSPI